MHLIKVRNLTDKTSIIINDIKTDNILYFLAPLVSNNQEHDKLYSFEFSKNNNNNIDEIWFTLNNEINQFYIEKVSVPIANIIYNMLNLSKQDKANIIGKKVIDIKQEKKYDSNTTEQQISDFAQSLDQNKSQSGGFLIWAAEKYLFPKASPNVATGLWGFLEGIDIAFMIISVIPVVSIPFDIASFIWSFLRFDVAGMIGSVISIIPIIGDIAGVIIRVIQKAKVYTRRAKQGIRTVKDTVNAIKSDGSIKDKLTNIALNQLTVLK